MINFANAQYLLLLLLIPFFFLIQAIVLKFRTKRIRVVTMHTTLLMKRSQALKLV